MFYYNCYKEKTKKHKNTNTKQKQKQIKINKIKNRVKGNII